MIALDTNVLLRFILRDDKGQYEQAKQIVESCSSTNRAYISREVMIELVWVLRRVFRHSRQSVCDTLSQIALADRFELEERQDVQGAILAYESGHGDFADAMIAAAARRAGTVEMVTFDRLAARLPGVRLLDA